MDLAAMGPVRSETGGLPRSEQGRWRCPGWRCAGAPEPVRDVHGVPLLLPHTHPPTHLPAHIRKPAQEADGRALGRAGVACR